ncbi:MAG: 3-deoxy-8-phosphooctulonate synthase, partial [Pseudomonadota bacterium]
MTDAIQPPPNGTVYAGPVVFDNAHPISLMAGPCAMESRDHAMMMAEALKRISEELGIGLVFKTSFDKANRTSLNAGRGIGLDKAMQVFAEIK